MRIHETGGRLDEGQVERSLSRTHPRVGPVVQLKGLRQRVQLSGGLAHESEEQMQRVVNGWGLKVWS